MTRIPTLPQTIGLLALSRGQPATVLTPMTRRRLLGARWIAPQCYDLTAAGREALAASPHLERATRAIEGGVLRVWSVTSTTGLTLGSASATPRSRAHNRRRARIAAAAQRAPR